MRETAIEGHLRDGAKKIGGKAYKFISPGNNGVPDRLVCLPGGRIAFVETKAPGRTSTDLQKLQQERLRKMGFVVTVLDSKTKVDEFLSEMQK